MFWDINKVRDCHSQAENFLKGKRAILPKQDFWALIFLPVFWDV